MHHTLMKNIMMGFFSKTKLKSPYFSTNIYLASWHICLVSRAYVLDPAIYLPNMSPGVFILKKKS